MQALMELEELQLFLLLRPFLLCGVGSFVRLRLFRRGGRAFFGHREVTLRHFSRGDTLSDAGGGGVRLRTFILQDFRYGMRLPRPTEELYQQENDSCHRQRMKGDDQPAAKVPDVCVTAVHAELHRAE